MTITVVYFSTKSGNTERLVKKLNAPLQVIPLKNKGEFRVDTPYVLAFPTYGGGYLEGAIPPPVKAFLNVPENRALLKGVIATGNRNFGNAFCLGGHLVARKCQVPLIREVEVFGTPDDVSYLNHSLLSF